VSDVVTRGEQAQRLLTDPLFQEARATVLEQIKEAVCAPALGDREMREQAVSILKGAEQFFRYFDLVLLDYDIHLAELTNEAQLKARHKAIEEQISNV
jgi:hypothetical protein